MTGWSDRNRRPVLPTPRTRRAAGAVVLAVVAALSLSACTPTQVFGLGQPRYPQPTVADVTNLPDLPDLPDTPTWDEFNTKVTKIVADAKTAGTVTDTSRLDAIVAKLAKADHSDPNVRAVLRTVLRQVTNQADQPAKIDVAAQSSSSALKWTSCGPEGLECASLTVPEDYSKPSGKTVAIKLDRYAAKDESKRIGILLSNPGGPGGSGVDFLPSWYKDLSDDIKDSFDVISFDPRGVGQSDPIICGAPPEPYSDKIVANPTTQTEEDDYAAEADKFSKACSNSNGPYLGEVGSKDVAMDMDEMRKAMGEDQISYVGYSYGTVIGQVYANMFPDKVRGLVLDGIVDTGLTKQQLSSTQNKAFDNALRRFVKSCPKVCNGLAQYLTQETAQNDIPAKFLEENTSPREVQTGILGTLYSPENWPFLAYAMRAAAVDKDGTLLGLAADNYGGRSIFDGEYPGNGDDSYLAVMCHDFAVSKIDKAFALARSDNRLHPVFANAPDVICNEWEAKPDPLGPLTWPKSTPVLLVSTTGDPATPHSMGKTVAARNPASTLLTHNGDGHTVYNNGNKCVDSKVDAFLLTGKSPAKGTTCQK